MTVPGGGLRARTSLVLAGSAKELQSVQRGCTNRQPSEARAFGRLPSLKWASPVPQKGIARAGPAGVKPLRRPGLDLRREVTRPPQTSGQELPLGRVPGQGQSPAIRCGRLVLTS